MKIENVLHSVRKLTPQQLAKQQEQQVEKQIGKKEQRNMLSGLFVNQQTDHSQVIRAQRKASQATQKAMDNKMASMTSLLQAQMSYEEANVPENNASYHGPLDLSYSRRARIGRRGAVLYRDEAARRLNRATEANTEKSEEQNATQKGASEAIVHATSRSVSRRPRLASAPVTAPSRRVSIRV
ncbi:hypothetical protein [Halodesulfovibrio sp.]|uniref:hypothetical protein n=1 Tax=Halodesulfovibrio sp. TaxID=1912772 RepID=UPI0025F09F3D|nr:hypothetical protein [Halodesulfovibrio sp.]MCT4625462.1 hypothetical protein [Halodesulfovibrio sp.]